MRIQRQQRHRHRPQPGLGRRRLPVVHGATVSVQRSREHLVELVQVAACDRPRDIDAPRKRALEFDRLAPHRAQEIATVHRAVEAPRQAQAPGHQVERHADHGSGPQQARVLASLAEPFAQHVAAERNADRVQRGIRPAQRHRPQDPVHLVRIATVVRAGPQVAHPSAAAEVNDQRTPAARHGLCHQRQCIVAARGAFQAMEQHQHRCGRHLRLRLREVGAETVAVRALPDLAPVCKARARHPDRGRNRLRVPARHPARCLVLPANQPPILLSEPGRAVSRHRPRALAAPGPHDAAPFSSPRVSWQTRWWRSRAPADGCRTAPRPLPRSRW